MKGVEKVKSKKSSQSRLFSRKFSESDFWKKIALQQQAVIHAKNRT